MFDAATSFGELSGGAKRTSSGRPWQVVALVTVGEKIPALKLEWQLKRARGKKKRLALFRDADPKRFFGNVYRLVRARF